MRFGGEIYDLQKPSRVNTKSGKRRPCKRVDGQTFLGHRTTTHVRSRQGSHRSKSPIGSQNVCKLFSLPLGLRNILETF
jgi:hypothetical protein